MKCAEEMMRLYAVTDRAWVGKQGLTEQVEAALQGGASCIQLREKELSEAEFLQEAIKIGALCRQYEVPFIINDAVEIAIRCGADGVHVGQKDMDVADVRRLVDKEMIIGVSVHTVAEALQAVRNGADYLGVGAMFATSTKSDAELVSRETLCAICDAVSVPVVAIGGVGRTNLLELAGTGVDGVALVSAIFSAADIVTECRLLRKLSEEMVQRGY